MILSQASLNVVQLPEIAFGLNGRRPRRIYIECFDPAEKAQAQKDATVLASIMKERIFGPKIITDDRPIVQEAVTDSGNGDG